MIGIIYKITNLVNGKIYIGQTVQSLKKRFEQHCGNKKSVLGRAIQKYGKENFYIETVEECDTIEELNEREKFWIAKSDCIAPKGYNLTEGGEGASHSEVTRQKMSVVNRKRFENIAEREKIAEKLRGRKDSEEVKAKKSAAQKKRYSENPLACQKQSEGLKIRFSNPEERKKNSVTMKKYKAEHPVSEETRAKIFSTKAKYRKKVICVETGEIFKSVSDAAKFMNVEPTRISRVCRGVRQTYHGYHWKFVED